MPPDEAARDQLSRILRSAAFSRNTRLSAFLRFVVERHLEGQGGDLKESLIGYEVFGRKPDYDPKLDSIVRTEAGRLRSRLLEYYAKEGAGDALIITLPKGGYAPSIEDRVVPVQEERCEGKGRLRWIAACFGAAAMLACASAGFWWFHKSAPITVAVLPLENLGHDPANDDLADGLTDELIGNLATIEGLEVRSRTSSFEFKGKPRSAREVGSRLNVAYFLEGSVLRRVHGLRINAQLIRVKDDLAMWSGSFDLEPRDIFAIQDEVARGIVNHLRLTLGRTRRRYETSVEAYDLYLRTKGGHGRPASKIDSYRQVVHMDAAFAPAYAATAAALASRSASYGANQEPAEIAKDLSDMRRNAETALHLDPLLAEAHSAMGEVYAREGRWADSERSFRRAIEIEPNRSDTYQAFAFRLLWPLGRAQEAVRVLQQAERADPLSPSAHADTGLMLLTVGRFDEAAVECSRDLPIKPYVRQCLARAELGKGRNREAVQILSGDGGKGNPLMDGWLGYALAKSGRREEAETKAANSKFPNERALIFAGLGDPNRTLEALDRMAVLGPQRVGQMLSNPEFAFLRGDPRLGPLRKRVGLPD